MKHENRDAAKLKLSDAPQRSAARRHLLILVLIFCTALGVRLLNWQTARHEAFAVQSSVALNYKHLAGLIRANGLASLYDRSSTTSNPDLLGHPPGYPILLSFIYRVARDSDTATQLLQMMLDSLSAIVIVLIAFELFPAAVGIIAGFLAALAPQFSWNSILLLPDSLAALPILLAMLLITKALPHPNAASERSSIVSIFAAGALIGVSVWLRANSLLLAPFLTLLFLVIRRPGARLRPAVMLICGALLVIAPITIRNAIVYGKFIPVSLGAGQTLIEGIADYNSDGSLGMPQTDMELIRGEAETAHRPEYASSLFTPDGIERDRARLARGLTVIRAHPIWFAGVMIQRAAAMLRLERTPLGLGTTTSRTWLKVVQWPLHAVQKIFITAIFLPLFLVGTGLLLYHRRFQSLATLLVIPFYYFCTQSALHTEYRYVLVIDYFLFVLAALAIDSIVKQTVSLRRLATSQPEGATTNAN
jgi:hypothetical protein